MVPVSPRSKKNVPVHAKTAKGALAGDFLTTDFTDLRTRALLEAVVVRRSPFTGRSAFGGQRSEGSSHVVTIILKSV